MFVGMGAAKVRDLFKQASEKAPCIVFIDEIDTIGKKRDTSGMGGGNDEREQTLNQLLTEMDGFDGTKGVVILAATNRPETLDPALLRPGRFDRRIPVELPDLAGPRRHPEGARAQGQAGRQYRLRERSPARLPARAGADLANIVNEAALRAVRDGPQFRHPAGFRRERGNRHRGRAEEKRRCFPKTRRRLLPAHEIGHALVAALQTHSAPVQKITIIPRTIRRARLYHAG